MGEGGSEEQPYDEITDRVAKVAADAGFKRLRIEGEALPENKRGAEINLAATDSRPRGRLSALLGRLIEGVARRV